MPESRAFPLKNYCARRDCTMATGGGDVVGPGALGAAIGQMPASWDLEADVVVIGAGATGLPAAIAAIDAGASVLVVEANYDIGGDGIFCGGQIPPRGGPRAPRPKSTFQFPGPLFSHPSARALLPPHSRARLPLHIP